MLRAESQVIPIRDLFEVNDGGPITVDVVLPANTRGLIVGAAGLLNVTLDGNDYDGVPFLAGVTPGFFEKVRSGSASLTIFAIL